VVQKSVTKLVKWLRFRRELVLSEHI